MIEQWKRWEPIEGLPYRTELKKLSDDDNGISLILYDERSLDTSVIVLFRNAVMAYRNTDEGKRLKMMNILGEQYGEDFFTRWCFFKVENSEYLAWFHEQSYNMYKDYQIHHFVIVTSNDIIEILSTYEPVVSIESIDSK